MPKVSFTVSLTQAGEYFLTYAYDIIDSFNKAVTFDKDNPLLSGTLRVGVLESLLMSRLSNMLPEYCVKE